MESAKPLKRWSGRRGSNPRRPAWEAGILPLNYSRVPLFSATSLSGKDLAAFAASLYRPCNPSRTMGSDRKMDSKTDSKPAPRPVPQNRLSAVRCPLHDNINISQRDIARHSIAPSCSQCSLNPILPSRRRRHGLPVRRSVRMPFCHWR